MQISEKQSDIALKYFDLWSKKEYEASAQYLDEHLSFTGPIDKFDNARDYVQSIKRLAQIVTGPQEEDVCRRKRRLRRIRLGDKHTGRDSPMR